MGRKSTYFWLAVMALVASSAGAEPFLRIVQPYEEANIPSVNQSFVFGSVLPATATLTINGQLVTPHANGGFLQMIPFEAGRFQIEAVAYDGISTTTVTRIVNVQSPLAPFALDSSDLRIISPAVPQVVRAGDTVEVALQAAPGSTVTFHLEGVRADYPLVEQAGKTGGIYRASYVVQDGDKFKNSHAEFRVRRRDGKRLTTKSDGFISALNIREARVIELREDAVLLTSPDSDSGYNLFFIKGTRLVVSGEIGEFIRVKVGNENEGWIKRSMAQDLPAGTPLPRSVSRNMRVYPGDQSTIIEIPLQYRHPHRMEQMLNPHRLRLTLWGVTADTDRIRYRSQDTAVKDISWYQSTPDTFVVDILTDQSMPWGYDVRYDSTTLIVEVRDRPVGGTKDQPLKGLRVAVDAGHSKENFGTIGPWGNTEAALNLLAARAVKQELEKKGAQVILTQDGTREVSLTERVTIAWQQRANLFISIHGDACPEGQNPREIEGYSVHYFQPQSRRIAELVHKHYGQKTGLHDQGLWRSNLAVCRTTQMPSILLEQAFVILPEYEELLLTPKHHRHVADAITESVVTLVKESRQ